MRSVRGAALALTAMFVALALAPPLAAAKGRTDKYAGPVNLPELEPGVVPHASIEFKVRSKKKGKQKRFDPKTILPLKERNMYWSCTNGRRSYPSDGFSENNFSVVFPSDIKVKNRKFSKTDHDLGLFFTVTGRIPRKGPATGTVRIRTHVAASSDPLDPHGAYDCDSGVVSWTASKI